METVPTMETVPIMACRDGYSDQEPWRQCPNHGDSGYHGEICVGMDHSDSTYDCCVSTTMHKQCCMQKQDRTNIFNSISDKSWYHVTIFLFNIIQIYSMIYVIPNTLKMSPLQYMVM